MAASAGALALALVLVQLSVSSHAWSIDGHAIICNIARPLLTVATATKVNTLLNSQFQHNFSTLCTWGDEVQYLPQYSWSPPLHFINTPDNACSYDYTRDCVGIFGEPNYCSSGAIKNFTSQLVNPATSHNQTEALLFLSNILGDIHQPLRVGFAGNGGGQFIRVWWLNTLNGSHTDLFSVWDTGMVHTAYERYYNVSTPVYNETLVNILGNMSLDIYSKMTAGDVAAWSPCPAGNISCPDVYAAESVQLACQWAYAGIPSNQILPESYFSSRLTIVEQRLQQAGVRLAATLNRLFDASYVSPPSAPSTPSVPSPGPSLPPIASGGPVASPPVTTPPPMAVATPPIATSTPPSAPAPLASLIVAPPPTKGSD